MIAIFELITDNKQNVYEDYYKSTSENSLSNSSSNLSTSYSNNSVLAIDENQSNNISETLNDFNTDQYICYGSIDPNNLFKNQVIVTKNDLIKYINKNNSLGNFLIINYQIISFHA